MVTSKSGILCSEQGNENDTSFLEEADTVTESPLSDFAYDPENFYESPLVVSPTSAISEENDSAIEPFIDFWTYQSQFFVDFNRVIVVLVNDSLDTHTPVANLSLTNANIRLGVTSGRLKLNLQLDCGAESYNPRNTAWEPVMELWTLNVALEAEKRSVVGMGRKRDL